MMKREFFKFDEFCDRAGFANKTVKCHTKQIEKHEFYLKSQILSHTAFSRPLIGSIRCLILVVLAGL